jgi:hypothetical protein
MRNFLFIALLATALTACGVTTTTGTNTPVPASVVAVYPDFGATGVPTDTSVWAQFDSDIDASSLTGTFSLVDEHGATIVVSAQYDSLTFTLSFFPSSPLAFGTLYHAAFTAAAPMAAAGVLAEDVDWSFSTAAEEIETPGEGDGEGETPGEGEGEGETPGEGEGEGETPGEGEGEGETPGEGEGDGDGEGDAPVLSCEDGGDCAFTGGSFDTIVVPAGATYVLTDVTVNNLVVGAGATVIGVNLVVNKSVSIDGAAHVGLDNAWIKGNLKIYNGGSVDMRNSRVNGDLDLRYNAGFIDLLKNRVGDDLFLHYNTGGATLVDNDVEDDLMCSNNAPAPTGSGNTADDAGGQCSAIADDD